MEFSLSFIELHLCRVLESEKKLKKKNLDMIVANNVKVEGAGFAGDTNIVTLITGDDETQLPLLSKEETAVEIMNKILEQTEKQL